MLLRMMRAVAFRMLCFLPVLALIGAPAAAQTGDELAVLNMFYSEKELTVVTAARAPRSISQTPENITVITADQIRRMNAHHLDDILQRIPGIYIPSTQDFGSVGATFIQGSESRHVRVLLDGMNLNYITAGVFQSNAVPVEIIDRIEIIKGPASSVWGSSLGGVINIITKNTGYAVMPSGIVQGSYGEGDSQDYRAAAAGAAGPAGYYLYAGHQTSHGLMPDRGYERDSLFGKLSVTPFDRVDVDVSMGYSDPYVDNGQIPSFDIESEQTYSTWFGNLSVNASLSRDLDASLFAYALSRDNTDRTDTLGLGVWGAQPELFQEQRLDEDVMGAGARLVYRFGSHSAVLGADFESADVDRAFDNGPALQQFLGSAPGLSLDADRTIWGLYANTTLSFGDLSLALGGRYDDTDESGSYFSPSIGATYQVTDATLLRATGSSGFNTPPLADIQLGGFLQDPNPDLEPEEILSGQIGIETSELEMVWLKASYFYHETRKSLVEVSGAAPSGNDLVFNRSDILRRGVEVEAETRPFYDIALYAGGSYVNITPPNSDGAEDQYTLHLAVKYDDGETWNAELWGRYTWFNVQQGGLGGEYDDFIWHASVNKTVYIKGDFEAEIFGAAHNLFNGDQHALATAQNPDRWAEIGLRFRF